jgi:hypothetical protein
MLPISESLDVGAEIKICHFSAYAKETRTLKEPPRRASSHPPVSYPPADVRLIWGTLFWWCQPADVIVKEQINTRGRGCMCPSDEVTFLPLFILVLPGSSFHHRARTRRRALRASQKSTGEDCLPVENSPKLAIQFTAHVYIFLPCFYEC